MREFEKQQSSRFQFLEHGQHALALDREPAAHVIVDADRQFGTVERRGEALTDLDVAEREGERARARVLDTGRLHRNMDKDLVTAVARRRHLHFEIARIGQEGQRKRRRQRHRAI